MTRAERYSTWVLSPKNRHKTGDFVKKACLRFQADLKRKDIYFDRHEAERVVNFTEKVLLLWEDPYRGKNVVIYDWQAFIIQNIFGWKKNNGNRRLRRVYIQVARKNGKTTLLGVIIAIHLFIDSDTTPQVLVGANNEDQAKICTTTTGKMFEISPEIKKLIPIGALKIYKYKSNVASIILKRKGRDGVIKAMSGDAETKDGFNPSLGAIDEYHEASDDSLLNVIESGQGARVNPLMICITTAGFNMAGPCYSKLRASGVNLLNGVNEDDSFFPLIYEQDENDDWEDSKKWVKSNPMSEYSDTISEYLDSRAKTAKNEGGSKLVDFKTKNLNMWVSSSSSWIDVNLWDKLNGVEEEEDLTVGKCYMAVDIAKTRDVNSISIVWQNLYFKNWCLMPEGAIDSLAKIDKIDYRAFHEKKDLILTHGDYMDDEYMEKKILELVALYNPEVIYFDRAKATNLILRLMQEGLNIQEFRQSPLLMSMPIDKFTTLCITKKLRHDGNSMVRWMMQNAKVKMYRDDFKMLVKENFSLKIDNAVTMVMALAAMDNDIGTKGSIYDDREIFIL
jgi:phage terminase large subunit-like protein